MKYDRDITLHPTMSALPLVAVAQSNSPCDIVGDICQAIHNIYDI